MWKWKLEVKTLKKEKQNLYNQILEMWEDIEQAEKVKVCLEQLYKKERQLKKSNNYDLGL